MSGAISPGLGFDGMPSWSDASSGRRYGWAALASAAAHLAVLLLVLKVMAPRGNLREVELPRMGTAVEMVFPLAVPGEAAAMADMPVAAPPSVAPPPPMTAPPALSTLTAVSPPAPPPAAPWPVMASPAPVPTPPSASPAAFPIPVIAGPVPVPLPPVASSAVPTLVAPALLPPAALPLSAPPQSTDSSPEPAATGSRQRPPEQTAERRPTPPPQRTTPAPRPASPRPAGRPAPANPGASQSAATAPTEVSSPGAALAAGPPLITVPRFRRAPQPPEYPARAIELDITGTVVIRALLNPEGDPREVRVHRSSGQNMLDSAAVFAVRRWAFEPASRDGQRIEAWVEVPVHFRLN